MSIKVWELREALAKFDDQDIVVVTCDKQEVVTSHARAVTLEGTTVKALGIEVYEIPVSEALEDLASRLEDMESEISGARYEVRDMLRSMKKSA